MSLQALNFKSAQDISGFIRHLIDHEAIKLVDQDGISSITVLKENHLLKANDGDIYLLHHIRGYLAHASAEEIEASNLRFTTLEGQQISLSQIKAKESIINKLRGEVESWKFIQQWNPQLYLSLPKFPVTTIDEINQAKNSYGNSKLNLSLKQAIAVLSMGESLQPLVELATLGSHVLLPAALKASDFMSTMSKDFLKITLCQERIIKQHLVNERAKLTNLDTYREIETLDQWIQEIDENNINTKKIVRKTIDSLKRHQNTAEEARLKFAQLERDRAFPEGTIIESKNREIGILRQKLDDLGQTIAQKSNWLNKLKPVVVYGLLAITLLLIFTAVPITVALLVNPVVGVTTGFVILAIVSLAIAIMGFPGFKLESIKNSIEEKIDSYLAEERAEQRELNLEMQTLWQDSVFLQHYSKLDNEFLAAGGNHNGLIEALETDLREMDEFVELYGLVGEPSMTRGRHAPSVVSPFTLFRTDINEEAKRPSSVNEVGKEPSSSLDFGC